MKSLAAILLLVLATDADIRETFNGGETLDYNLHWAKVAGGSARMTIAPSSDSRYRITSVAKSGPLFSRVFKVRDEFESIVDRTTFSTIEVHKRLDERGKKKEESTVIEGKSATRKGKTIALPDAVVFDPISLIYYVRTLDLKQGASHEFTVLADGKVYVVHADVVRRETIATPAGKFDTVLVEPRMEAAAAGKDDEPRRLFIWYSDDERRLPVRIRTEVKVGAITATLRAIQPGVNGIEPVTVRGQ